MAGGTRAVADPIAATGATGLDRYAVDDFHMENFQGLCHLQPSQQRTPIVFNTSC